MASTQNIYDNNISDFDAVQLSIASPADILEWSSGEVKKPETINYRTQKPERDGLFCERIFGPVKDINPHDSKYKGVRSREAAVDKNGELVTKSIVRRERMGHISLAVPVAHIWFMRGAPSAIGLLLGLTVKNLEKIAYFASYVIIDVKEDQKDQLLADKEAELAAAQEAIKLRYEHDSQAADANLKALSQMMNKELDEIKTEFEIYKNQFNSLVKLNLITEAEYRDLSEDLKAIIEVGMGGTALYKLLSNVDINQLINELTTEAEEAKGLKYKKILKRLRLIESLNRANIEPTSLCVTILPVIPPDLRPMVQLTGGRFATSDLNDLYRRVINRNNRLKKLIDLNAPEIIQRNEQRMLQEAVDALIDNNSNRNGRAIASTGQRRKLKSLSDMLKGKQGRFRQNLLGKRVDYSGRSVIVSGPELSIDECGLPKMMALELFKPYVMGELIKNDYAHNIKTASRLLELGDTVVWDALDKVIQGKYVLLNRAPSLHRLSIQSFRPVLIEGRAIQLHPLVCKGFNADFDGDQMAVHLPLSDESQAEARDILSATKNLLKPADGSPILHIEQDIVLGCYFLTYEKPELRKAPIKHFSSIGEMQMAIDKNMIGYQHPVIVAGYNNNQPTTSGRILFNEIFPEDFEFANYPMAKKQLQAIMADVYRIYGQDVTAVVADRLKDLGFYYATISGLSMGMGDFEPITGMDKIISQGDDIASQIDNQFTQGFITEEERYRLTVDNWLKVELEVQDSIGEQVKDIDNSISIAIVSGARGNISQLKQTVAMVGVLQDASGATIALPIKHGYTAGLTPLEYYTGTRGTRKALIDIALKTADAGYLTRRLVDVAQDVFTINDPSYKDPGFEMLRSDADEIGISFGSRLVGRYLAEDLKGIAKANALITTEIAAAIDQDESIKSIKIMSVLSCPNPRGVQPESYGLDPASGQLVSERHPIGVIAAQSIGEPGTQLSLHSKHRSGSLVADSSTQGLNRIEELLEARSPKGVAYLCDIGGTVNVWEEADKYIVQITSSEQEIISYPINGRNVQIANGQEVVVGDVLATSDDSAIENLVSVVSGEAEVDQTTIRIIPKEQSHIRYEIPNYKELLIKDGDQVTAGDRITTGSIDLHDLVRLKGIIPTQRYILNETLKIFAAQGQYISDKHLEIIVRQMFSRVQVEDAGDSDYVTGDIISKLQVSEVNESLTKLGKKPILYNQLLLGITKSSLATESFLSAASFQDTNRILNQAATSGKIDYLNGLKENVILGRKIPVGTGYKPASSSKESTEDNLDN